MRRDLPKLVAHARRDARHQRHRPDHQRHPARRPGRGAVRRRPAADQRQPRHARPRPLPRTDAARRAGAGARGLDAAKRAGFDPIKINAVTIRGVDGARRGAAGPLLPRARPGDALHRVHADRRRGVGARQGLLRPRDPRAASAARSAPLVPADDYDPTAPAMDFDYADGGGRVGIIASVSRPFCHELQPPPPDRRRQAAQLPVRPRRDRREGAACAADAGRRGARGRDPPERAGRSGKGTRSTPRGSSSRSGPCTPSAGSAVRFGLGGIGLVAQASRLRRACTGETPVPPTQ